MAERLAQTPDVLRDRIAQVDRGLKKAGGIVLAINADTFHPRSHLDPSILSGREYIGSIRRLTEIKVRLEDRAIPTLSTVREEAIKKLDITGAEADLKELREWFSQGRVSKEVMERAEAEYAKLVGVVPEVRLKRMVRIAPDEQPKKKEDERKAVVDLEKKTVEIDGKVIKFKGTVTWSVLLALARRAKGRVDASTLGNVARRAGSSDKVAAIHGVSNLKSVFYSVGVDPNVLISQFGTGQTARYRLNCKVDFIGLEGPKRGVSGRRKEREPTALHDVELPDGTIVREEPGDKVDLSPFGGTDVTADERYSDIAKTLGPGQVLREINGRLCICRGRDIIEEIVERSETGAVQTSEDDFEEDSDLPERPEIWGRDAREEIVDLNTPEEEVGVRQPACPVASAEEFRVIPYEPSVEDVLSQEEAKVLSVLTRYFLQHDITVPVDPVTIIRELHELARRHVLENGKPYTAHELGNLFNIAYYKIYRDSRIESIRESWPEGEREIWAQIERLAERMRVNLDDERGARQVRANIVRQLARGWRNLSDTSREGAQRSARGK